MGDTSWQVDRLRTVLDVARQLAATTDLDRLLGQIIDSTCRVLDCERATIFLYDAQTSELYSRVATGGESIRFPADQGIAGAAARARRVVNVPDAYADTRFNQQIDKRTGFRTRNILSVPLENLAGELVGVLQALNKAHAAFDDRDEELGQTLAAQAGVAVHRARLLIAQAEKERLARDLDIARNIQQGLFPKKPPHVAGYSIAGWNRSADATGGDAYDFIDLPDGRLGVFLADATGHGIGAALVIAECRALIRALLTITADLKQVVSKVNNLLIADLESDRFVTAFLGVLDPRKHELTYLACGQGPLLLASASGVESHLATDLPLATVAGIEFSEPAHFAFDPGSTLVLLTDGFYETQNPQRELFGEQRVIDLLRDHARQSPAEVIALLDQHTTAFANGGAQADDLTAVLVRRDT